MLQLTGKIHRVLPLVTGEGKNGTWRKQEFILETNDQYPKQICISAWGDKIDENIIKAGVAVTVSVDIESREYNGRWYTDVKAWKFDAQNAPGAASGASTTNTAPATDHPLSPLTGEEDLPF